MKNLNQSSQYKKFIDDRDRALQVFHNKTQRIISDCLRGAFENILTKVQAVQPRLTGPEAVINTGGIINEIDRTISQTFDLILPEIIDRVQAMRKNAFVMSAAGEVEAIGRAMDAEQTADIKKDDADAEVDRESSAGGHLPQRLCLYFDRLRRKLLDAVQMGIILQDNRIDFMNRVYKALPPQRKYKRPDKVLKKVKESATLREQINFGAGRGAGTPVGGVSMTTGFIDPPTWDNMVADYLTEYIPTNRGPEAVLDIDAIPNATKTFAGTIPPTSAEQWYLWELERDITQEFVDSVRKGQVDAAKKNGINEFVWISIVDSKTDSCCLWRDGLTSKEIGQKLKGDKSSDPCKAIVPPAHFNCRCTLAGVTKQTIPDKPRTDLGDFEKWLINPNA